MTESPPKEELRDEEFETLLAFIKVSRGFDFTGYKRPSLQRRISRRMEALGLDGWADYQDFLEANSAEFAALFDTILINVTSFFRDPGAWEYLRGEVVPRIVERKGAEERIRVWSAGCASGEEAYTAAMIFADALGEEERHRVKVYATDVDELALTEGRHATYAPADVEPVPEPLRERFFEQHEGRFLVVPELRRAVIFGRHDLVRDPPISRVDLLLARNTLMYFNPQLQEKILTDFHFALENEGFLFLGKSEMLLTRSSLFEPVDLKCRVFAKAPGTARVRRTLPSEAPQEYPKPSSDGAPRLEDAAFETAPTPHLVIDTAGRLAVANHHARRLFGITQRDVGKPLQDLELSYRPLELRSRIEDVYAANHPIAVRDVEWRRGGDSYWFDVQLSALHGPGGIPLGTAITFSDVTRSRTLRESYEAARERLETAYEELQSTAEELETTNEELQSTNEELETTNEELQSTNEELETMNEELQSTNEELETINDELRERTDQLHEANAFLEAILGSLDAGVAVVDEKLVVEAWNDRAADLWGLREDEVQGQHLHNLDIGLPVAEVGALVRACFASQESVDGELDAVNRRGRAIRCAVGCTPLRAGDAVRGVIVQMRELGAGTVA